jgi:hypothetical protein
VRTTGGKPIAQQAADVIGLFAGLRPSENAQMRLDSIRHERGLLCLIVEEETKTEGSRPAFPLPVSSAD